MIPTFKGYSVVFIPYSWGVGVWRKKHKTIYAFGPFRFALHYGLGPWKSAPKFEPDPTRGVWLSGPSSSERLTGSNVLAGGALEPTSHAQPLRNYAC